MPLIIELGQAALVDFERAAHLLVAGEQPLTPIGIAQDDGSENPRRSVTGHLGDGLGEPVVAREVIEINSNCRTEPPLKRQLGSGSRHLEISERITQTVGVAPEPVQVTAIERRDDAVRSGNLRVEQRPLNRRGLSQQHTVGIDPRASHTIQPLGNVEPPQLQSCLATRLDHDRPASIAEPILGELIPVTAHVKEDVLPE